MQLSATLGRQLMKLFIISNKNRIRETKKVLATSKSVSMATMVSRKASEEPPKAPATKPLSCVLCRGAHKIGFCSSFLNIEAKVKKMRASKQFF